MAVIHLPCAGTCGRTIRVTDTGSLYQPDGIPHNVYCHDCYHEKGDASMTNQHCLQCGESRAAVKREGLYCADVAYDGEPAYEWDRHRWRDWTDKELARVGILPEHYDKYRRAEVYDLNFINCADKGREHIPFEESERVCCACWHDITKKETTNAHS